MTADATIRFDTKIDNRGFDKGLGGTEKQLDKMKASFNDLGSSITNAFSADGIENMSAALMKQQALVDDLQERYAAIANGEAAPKDLIKAEKDFAALQKEIGKTKTEYDGLIGQVDTLQGQIDLDIAARGVASPENQAAMAELDEKLLAVGERLDELLNKSSEAGNAINQIKLNPEMSQEAQEIATKLGIASTKLDEMQTKAAQVGATAPKALKDTGSAAQKAGDNVGGLEKMTGKFLNRIKSLALTVMVFQLFRTAFRGLRDYIGLALKDNQAFVNSLGQLKGNLATAFQPILQAIIPALTTLISWLATATQYLAAFLSMLFGKSVKSSQDAAKNMDKLAASTKKAGGASKDANKETEKMLATFDNINQLSAPDTSAGGGSGSDSIAPIYEDIPEPDLSLWDAVKNKIKEIADIFMTGFWEGFANPDFSGLLNSLSSIWGSLKNIFTDPAVVEAFNKLIQSWVYNLGRIIGSIVSIGKSIAEGIIGGIAIFLEENKESIKEHLISMFDILDEIFTICGNWWVAIADIFTVFAGENSQQMVAAIIGIFYEIGVGIAELALRIGRDFISLITEPIVQNKDAIKTALDGLLGVFASILGNIKELIRYTFSSFAEVYDEHIKPFIDSVKASFTEWFEHLLNGWNTYIQPVLDSFATQFTDLVENTLKPMIDKACEFFGKLFDTIKLVWDNLLSPFITWVIDILAPKFGAAFQTMTDLVFAIGRTVGEVVGGIFDVLSGLIDFLVGVFTGDWEKAWNGVQQIFKGVWNGIVSLIEKALNFIVDGLNKIEFDVPDWVPGIGGSSFGFDFKPIKIPRLATGAVIPPNKEFLAILGDQSQGTNIEAPLSTIEQALRNVMGEKDEISDDTPIIIQMNIEGQPFGEAVYKWGEVARNRRGNRFSSVEVFA